MKPFQIFAAMTPEHTEAFCKRLSDDAPGMWVQALGAAAAATKARPAYMARLPFPKQAASVRRALARVSSGAVAEEMLAIYFLQCRKPLLVEWLDALGVKHDEGTLEEDEPAQPDEGKLKGCYESFLAAEDDPDRRLLLLAFAAQTSIDWPALDGLLDAPG